MSPASLDLRLVRLHVAGYGRLYDYLLEPEREPGILVVAPNEAGKSTVCSALFRGLFGFPEKTHEELRRPWGGGPFGVLLEWTVGADLRCTIERDFESQTVVVEWRRHVPGAKEPVLERRWEGEPNPRGRSSDRATFDAELRRLLGFSSSELFRQTAYVGPGDTGVRPLAAELLRLLSGSDRTDFRTALAEFESHYYDLTQLDIRGSGRPVKQKPRRLEELAVQKAELTRRRDAAHAAREARRASEEAVQRGRDRILEIERDLTDRERAGEAFRKLADLRRQTADAERRREEMDRAIGRFVEWEKQVRAKTAELEPLVRYLRVPRDFSDRLRHMRALALERERVATEAEGVREAIAAEPGPAVEIALGVTGGFLAALAGALAAVGMPSFAVGAGLAALAFLGLTLARRVRRRGRLQRHVVEWSQLEGEALRLDSEREAIGLPLPPGLDPSRPDVEVERYERAQRLRAELDGMQATRTAMGDREPLEEERRRIKEERLDVLRLERLRLIEAHPYLDWGPDYERQFAVDRERLIEEIKRLEEEDLAHRRALAEVGEGVDDPVRLEARIAELGGEVERLSIERDAYRLTYETLTACKDEFVRVMTQRLQTRIGRVFDTMTGGRYDEVVIDPLTLELIVSGVEKRGVPSESLSRGTRDQLYFALRVAILEELAADRALPIILDDPFLHFDRDRLARVEETLGRLGATHQILLFTHDARLAGWAFPKQWLPAPSAREEVPASGG
jgi:hypothetical protein